MDFDPSTVGMLERVSKDFAANRGGAGAEIIQNHITIELDGTKVARKIVKTAGVRG